MKNWNWKDLVPHAIAVAIFVVVALVYCKPALEGHEQGYPELQGYA